MNSGVDIDEAKKTIGGVSGILLPRFYRNKLDSRGRRYVMGPGAQTCSRSLLKAACPHAQDFDIKNCVFTLLAQMVDKLQVNQLHPLCAFTCIRECAADREAVCRRMGLSLEEGKQVLHKTVNGGAVPSSVGD